MPVSLTAFIVLLTVYFVGIVIGVWYFIRGAKEEVKKG